MDEGELKKGIDCIRDLIDEYRTKEFNVGKSCFTDSESDDDGTEGQDIEWEETEESDF